MLGINTTEFGRRQVERLRPRKLHEILPPAVLIRPRPSLQPTAADHRRCDARAMAEGGRDVTQQWGRIRVAGMRQDPDAAIANGDRERAPV